MFCTHIYFTGQCREAIKLYKRAFHAGVLTLVPSPTIGEESEIIHAEILIHGQKLILTDFGEDAGSPGASRYELVVQFESIAQLEESYDVLVENSLTISPRQSTRYSSCVVRFVDRFGIRWALFV